MGHEMRIERRLTDADSELVARAWPGLRAAVKAGILAMVKAANQPHPNRSQAGDDLPTHADRC